MSQARRKTCQHTEGGLSQDTGRAEWWRAGLHKLETHFPLRCRRSTGPWLSHSSKQTSDRGRGFCCHCRHRAFFQALSKGLMQTKTLAWTLGLLFLNQAFAFIIFLFLLFFSCATLNFSPVFINWPHLLLPSFFSENKKQLLKVSDAIGWYLWNALDLGSANFSAKDWTVRVPRFCRPQSLCQNYLLSRCHVKAASDSTDTNVRVCLPVKLYLQKQSTGSFDLWVVVCWLLPSIRADPDMEPMKRAKSGN